MYLLASLIYAHANNIPKMCIIYSSTNMSNEHVLEVRGLPPHLAVKIEPTWGNTSLLDDGLQNHCQRLFSLVTDTGANSMDLHHECAVLDVHGKLVSVPAEVGRACVGINGPQHSQPVTEQKEFYSSEV